MFNPIPRKPVTSAGIISIDSLRPAASSEPQPPQPAVAKRKSRSSNEPHLYTRRSILHMFLVGSGVRKVANHHRLDESVVESVIRRVMPTVAQIRSQESERAA